MRGMTVTLVNRVQTGVDAFNAPVYEDVSTDVDNVLVGEPTADDVSTAFGLYGKHVAYVLGIPKGDEHDWNDCFVKFFGQTFRSVGAPIRGIEKNIPTPWHVKVKVERYE